MKKQVMLIIDDGQDDAEMSDVDGEYIVNMLNEYPLGTKLTVWLQEFTPEEIQKSKDYADGILES